MDSGWLGILKASGWQLFGLGLALGVFWLLLLSKVIPPIDHPVAIYGLPLAMLITGGLGVGSLAEQLVKTIKAKLADKAAQKASEKAVADHQDQFRRDIATFSDREMHIFGYMLRENQKSFITQTNGGYATTLLDRNYIQTDVSGGQVFNAMEKPFRVPDHIWDVMQANSDRFPKDWDDGAPPWVIPLW